jgi:hypothetical protein
MPAPRILVAPKPSVAPKPHMPASKSSVSHPWHAQHAPQRQRTASPLREGMGAACRSTSRPGSRPSGVAIGPGRARQGSGRQLASQEACSPGAFRAIHRAFVGGRLHEGFRLVHCSVQRSHLHLIAEAPNANVLARAVQGLSVRLARGLNTAFSTSGRLFADRYHARVLKSPREVRLALRYVLGNARRHRTLERGHHLRRWLDSYSSAVWFDGWREHGGRPPATLGRRPSRAGPLGRDDPRFAPGALPETSPAASYLLTTGWRREGLLSTADVPGPDQLPGPIPVQHQQRWCRSSRASSRKGS